MKTARSLNSKWDTGNQRETLKPVLPQCLELSTVVGTRLSDLGCYLTEYLKFLLIHSSLRFLSLSLFFIKM